MEKVLGYCDLDGKQNPRGHKFSAAAAAIQFLRSLPDSIRSLVRNVVLCESKYSVAYPQSHVQGLIPFCVENPNLHITRNVGLWMTILNGHCRDHPSFLYHKTYSSYPHPDYRATAPWLFEAEALSSLGMPAGSFKFVICSDDQFCPDKNPQVFGLLKQWTRWRFVEEVAADGSGPTLRLITN
jgi:hypothetical protein